MEQTALLALPASAPRFRPWLSASVNLKGVLDLDTVKGCQFGMNARPNGGCYNACYANKLATLYGYDFSEAVSRRIAHSDRAAIEATVINHPATWFRIGTMGDPSHDWPLTAEVCKWLGQFKVPVIITKHWRTIPDALFALFRPVETVINTSVSALDTDQERKHRLAQHYRAKGQGLRAVLRIVSVKFGDTAWGNERRAVQRELFASGELIIDNPLRIAGTDPRVMRGDILVQRHTDLGGGSTVSLENENAYLGKCQTCPDQCGVPMGAVAVRKKDPQRELFVPPKASDPNVAFECVTSVIGSGYEQDVSRLAIKDGIAQRAARKNMQIHSAIILKVDGAFAGFMTFQKNHECKEFCLLQSVIEPALHTDELYAEMVREVIRQNTDGYPALITTDPKSKFETPALFQSLGFVTYLKMSGFHYMVKGPLAAVRHKFLAHITMCNVWNSIKGDWLQAKREWNQKIEEAGKREGVKNPLFASREGCWQGENGFANVVTRKIDKANVKIIPGRAQNGNASVLDPVACEVILRFFMPTDGRRVYNPFGGGVQFGFVTGSYGYEYVASEIRQNQCDANNKICAAFKKVKWVQSDSATYEPKGTFDLVFTCPPYYRVERYLDYDGKAPEGEINSAPTYAAFRDLLFAGYTRAIAHLRDNGFFVVMTGDSRDKNGAYYCSESETELFMQQQGLSVYNKIIYLESEFTRLAHAKKTLNQRKFPKREQKIIVGYKGNIKAIKDNFPPVGRL